MINDNNTPPFLSPLRYSVALRTVVTYLVVSILWIVLSDLLVNSLPMGQETKDHIQTFKGLIFVSLSTLLLYVVVRSFTREHEVLLRALTKNKEQLTALTRHLQTSIEDERTRISREIHDDLGQIMTALRMDIAMAGKTLAGIHDDAGKKSLQEEFTGMLSMIDAAIQSIRKIIRDLRPEVLDTLGLFNSIRWQAEDFMRRSHIQCTVNLPEHHIVFPKEISTALFRILQESLTNVLKHSQATTVEVTLSIANENVELTISDNGRGITHDDIAKINAFGLLGIRERTRTLNGTISISRGIPGGTVLCVVIPFDKGVMRV